MRLPRLHLHLRPRLRLRTLLIAVAVAGTALGGWQMWERREYCLERAAHHATRESQSRELAEVSEKEAEQLRKEAKRPWMEELELMLSGSPRRFYSEEAMNSEMFARGMRRDADKHARLADTYRHVARYPWLPLPSEPPTPEP